MEQPERMHAVSATNAFHLIDEAVPIDRFVKKLDELKLRPEQLIRLGYEERTDNVLITFAPVFPAGACSRRIPLGGAVHLLSAIGLSSEVTLFEASPHVIPKHHGKLGKIASAAIRHFRRHHDATQIVLAGGMHVAGRQFLFDSSSHAKVESDTGEVRPLSHVGNGGITSIRFDQMNRYLVGIRLNEAKRGTALVLFEEPQRRDPEQLFGQDAWKDIETGFAISVVSLSALNAGRGATKLIVNLQGGIRQHTHIAASPRGISAQLGNLFETPYSVVRRIEGAGMGLACALIHIGDKRVATTMDVAFLRPMDCADMDFGRFFS
jgi:hypothetical protein